MRFASKLIIIISFIYSIILSKSIDVYKYKIKFLGIPVATCEVSYSDTIIYNIKSKKLNYNVFTNSFIDKIFKINNHYTIIIDTSNYSTLYYKKNTYQPELINSIETKFNNGVINYKNSDIVIGPNDKNIFTVLYLIHTNKLDLIKKIDFLEREGKYYDFNFIAKSNNKFKLLIDEINSNNYGIIKNTDIFLWGLFLANSNNTIIFNKERKYIEKCIFKKGFTKITAKLY